MLAADAARCQAAGVAASEAGLSAMLRRRKGKRGLYTHAHADLKTGEKAVEVVEVRKRGQRERVHARASLPQIE